MLIRKLRTIATVFLFTAALAGPVATLNPAPASAGTPLTSQQIETAINWGNSFVGKARYTGACAGTFRMGGKSTANQYFRGSSCNSGQSNYKLPAGYYGFDCSGLVYRMFHDAAGISSFTYGSSTAIYDASALPTIAMGNIARGDLLVKRRTHVAVYLGRTPDGVPWALEASPRNILQTVTVSGVSYRVADGVMAVDARNYMASGSGYIVKRVVR